MLNFGIGFGRSGNTPMELGKPRHRVDASHELLCIAENDEEAADVLCEAGLYRNAAYFYIQSMEKRVRAEAFKLINPNNYHLRTTNQHHDLYSSVSFLVEVLGMDTLIATQVKEMIDKFVIGDTNFRVLHNTLRYPYYSERYASFTFVDFSKQDCDALYNKLAFLKNLLRDLDHYR